MVGVKVVRWRGGEGERVGGRVCGLSLRVTPDGAVPVSFVAYCHRTSNMQSGAVAGVPIGMLWRWCRRRLRHGLDVDHQHCQSIPNLAWSMMMGLATTSDYLRVHTSIVAIVVP